MAIEIRETFQVSAPIDQVWNFMKSPENLAGCMPGASLARIIDDRSFVGTVKLKVGAITASYDGTMSFIKLDDSARELTLLAEAKERAVAPSAEPYRRTFSRCRTAAPRCAASPAPISRGASCRWGAG